MLEKATAAVKITRKKKRIVIGNRWKNHPVGYPRLAERIAVKPETGIYRRFDALNARHLLYLQAELTALEDELRETELEDHKDSVGKRSKYATDYRCFLEEPSDMNMRQLELIHKMHAKLNQYNKAVIQVFQLHTLAAPDRFDLYDVQRFLASNDMGPYKLGGMDRNTWGDCNDSNIDEPPDLVGVHPRKKEDLFSQVIAEKGIHLFKCGLGRLTKGNKHLGERVYYDSTVFKVTFCLTSAMAALLPISSILVLINLHSTKAKLGTVAAFNVLISVVLTIFTDAKRTDVFAVNAAFAAVQVVFIATNSMNDKP